MEQETQLIRGVNLVVSSDDKHTLCLLIALFELHQRNRVKVDMARLWYVSKLHLVKRYTLAQSLIALIAMIQHTPTKEWPKQ